MLWDLNEGKHLYSLEAGDIINALTFSPNRYAPRNLSGPESDVFGRTHRYWLCAATSTCIKIFDLESKSIVDELKPEGGQAGGALPTNPEAISLAWSADGQTLFAGYTGPSLSMRGCFSSAYQGSIRQITSSESSLSSKRDSCVHGAVLLGGRWITARENSATKAWASFEISSWFLWVALHACVAYPISWPYSTTANLERTLLLCLPPTSGKPDNLTPLRKSRQCVDPVGCVTQPNINMVDRRLASEVKQTRLIAFLDVISNLDGDLTSRDLTHSDADESHQTDSRVVRFDKDDSASCDC